ncbi:MAG: putative peptidoglycan glycosyltransferase FtsW [Planctomycetota bacterium]
MVRSAHILIACVAALLGLGVLMVHSAGANVGAVGSEIAPITHPLANGGPWAMFMTKHTLFAGLAIVVMLVASRLNVAELFKHKGWISPVLLFVLLAIGLQVLTLIPGVGHEVNGASRWLKIGSFTFQPSEMVKWAMVLAVAWWCARRRGVMHKLFAGVVPPLILIGGACALIIKQDLGTGVLVGAVAIVMLIAGGMRLWTLIPAAALSGVGIFYAIVAEPYRVQRLMIYLDPWSDPEGAGYHPIQSQLAFAQGGVPGSGLGNSIQKYFLPEDTTDFIFPVLVEELGVAGAAMVIGLFLAIIWIGLGVVRDSKDTFSRLVALGVLVTVGAQAVINIAVVTVVVPTKGIALPLISAGGTGWVMTAFAIGLIAAIDNANHLAAGEVPTDSTDDTEGETETDQPKLRLTG